MTLSSDNRWKIEAEREAHDPHVKIERLQEIGDAMAADMEAMLAELIKAREALRFAANMMTSDEHTSDKPDDAETALDRVIVVAREALADTAKLLAAEAAMKEKG